MAENQAQAEHTLTSAPADDPDLKIQKLQDDVDQIKVSIKRLLIDIRERMNELENPFVSTVSSGSSVQGREGGTTVNREPSAPGGDGCQGSQLVSADHTRQFPPNVQHGSTITQDNITHPQQVSRQETLSDDRLIETLRSQVAARSSTKGEGIKQTHEKLRLTKVHRLFEWTSRMVKKYGHDRLDMMLQSYRAMGYISKESGELVKEITRLMPASIGESHDIGPDEFIKELYTLNRILDPADMSLDRDMIEVLMEQQRRNGVPQKGANSVDKESKEDWVRMLDGV